METQMEQMQHMEFADEEMTIDLREIFFLLLHKWKAILLALLAGGALFGAYHVFMVNPSYRADAKIYITNTESMISFADLQMSAALTDDYENIIKSRTVLERVIEDQGLQIDYRQLSAMVEVNNPQDSHIIQMYVTSDDVELSRNIANSLLNVSVNQIYQIIGSSEPTVIDYAKAEAVENVTPSLFKYLMMGAMLGAILVCGIEIVKYMMNSTVKNEEDVDKYLKLPVLAAIPYYNEK